jgi:hypothetical protein
MSLLISFVLNRVILVAKGRFLSSGRKRSNVTTKVGGVLVAALLLADAGAWYQVEVRSQRAPSFDRGGDFATATHRARASTTTTTASTASAPSITAPSATAPSAPPANAYAPAAITAVSAGGPARPGVLPAPGTYQWHVDGSERATGFGSRAYPATMTMVAHPGQGTDAGQVVLDVNYSADHQERLIVADQNGSLAATYEAGQVRFGPMAQANSGTYEPAMTYIPADLTPGVVSRGTSEVHDTDGKVERIEDWTLTVGPRSTIPVLGTPTQVWEVVLERTSRPGSSQDVHRVRRQWWDPSRKSVVRYRDTMHGQQSYGGVTFTFDSDLTADLASYTP